MSHESHHKNILFDLGGVILDLNINGTLEAFLELGFPSELLKYPENFHTDIFFKYETGMINTEEFRNLIRNQFNVTFSDEAFDEAWCKMLARVTQKRIEILKSLSGMYNLYMLSNTSEMHIEKFGRMFEEAGGVGLNDIFKKCYYSYEIGYHKPDEEAFQHVLNDAGIIAEETLFLDDNIQNIKAAQALGFNVIHITENLRMEHLGFDR